jgi:predicted nuclease with TOPRIM domain|tara:strand:+ start:397 stop:639 length:243 start_codon:yes stop_codon:yes gene_type:complete
MAEKNLKLDELTTEKTRLESDRKLLVDRLQELQTNAEQIKSQVQAMGGAIQTCDYFISKLQPPEEPEVSKVESETDGKIN